jgi:hypothetical protein
LFDRAAKHLSRNNNNRYGGLIALAVAALVAYLLRDRVPVRDMLLIMVGVALYVWAFDKLRRKTKYDRLAKFKLPTGEYPMEVLADLRVHADLHAVWNACRSAIDSLPNSGAKRTVLRGTTLRTRTSTSWASWGEIIDAAAEDADGQTILRIKSRPALSFILDDHGINFQNVALIVRSLRASFDVRVLESNVPLNN